MEEKIKLAQGAGGELMDSLIKDKSSAYEILSKNFTLKEKELAGLNEKFI